MLISKTTDLNTEDWLALYLAGFTFRQISSIGDALADIFTLKSARNVFAQVNIRDSQKANWLEYLSGQGRFADNIEMCLKWSVDSVDNYIIHCMDRRYPPLLSRINSPPLLLFVKGNPDVLVRPTLAMVGSRNPTATGWDIAHDFSRDIAARNIIVVSGLALGVDSASHQGAITSGSTVAVLGTGIDIIYPKRNSTLAEDICHHGALVSEFMLGTAPLAKHFPRRNRIISGLSLGVVVIEAARKSGSLITARLALDANREVFAVPGSIHNPLSKGCHQLIREGAILVESVPDILENLQIETKVDSGSKPLADISNLSQDARIVFDTIGFEPTPIDLITQRSGLNVSLVNSLLIEIELEGYISAVAGGYLRLR